MSSMYKNVEELSRLILVHNDIVIKKFKDTPNNQNQLFAMIKPEVFFIKEEKLRAKAVEKILSVIYDNSIDINGVYNISSKKIGETNFLEKNYLLLDIYSKKASVIIPDHIKNSIFNLYSVNNSVQIMGAFEFLSAYNEINEFELCRLWNEANVYKIDNGLYTCFINKDVIVVNGFYPAQLKHFTDDESRITVLILSTNTSWKFLRENVLGNTYPEHAKKGSIRNLLYNDNENSFNNKYGIINNYVHMSASPFEGMYEINNFFNCLKNNDFYKNNLRLLQKLSENNVDISLILDLISDDLELKSILKITELSQMTENMDTDEATYRYKLSRAI